MGLLDGYIEARGIANLAPEERHAEVPGMVAEVLRQNGKLEQFNQLPAPQRQEIFDEMRVRLEQTYPQVFEGMRAPQHWSRDLGNQAYVSFREGINMPLEGLTRATRGSVTDAAVGMAQVLEGTRDPITGLPRGSFDREGFGSGMNSQVLAAMKLDTEEKRRRVGETAPIKALDWYADAVAELRQQIKEDMPVDRAFAESKFGQVVGGFAQMIGQLPAYAIPGAGPAMAVGQLYQEGYDDAIRHGASPTEAHHAGLMNAPSASLEYVGDKLILGRILRPLKGQIKVGDLTTRILASAASEGGTEGVQQFWQNIVAKQLAGYDPDRKLDDEVINSIVVGAIVGGGVTGVGTTAKALTQPNEGGPETQTPRPETESNTKESISAPPLQTAEDQGTKTRQSYRSQQEQGTLSSEAQAAFEATGGHTYTPVPNAVTKEEAAAIIQNDGLEQTLARVRNPDGRLAPRQRVVLLDAAITAFDQEYQRVKKDGPPEQAQGILDRVIDLETEYTRLGTELGQGVQAFNMKGLQLVPAKWLRLYDRAVAEANETLSPDKQIAPDRETQRRIRELVDQMREKPEGFQREEIAMQIRKEIANQVPAGAGDILTSLAYASALSGYQTQLVNFSSTLLTSLGDAISAAAVHPTQLPAILTTYTRGLIKGLWDAGGVFKTGVASKGRFAKYDDVPNALERTTFKGLLAPLNLAKYVPRLMAASDMIFYRGAEEFQSRVLARDLARREGLKGRELSRRVNELLGQQDGARPAAEQQATAEGLTGNRYRRRVNEIIHQARDERVANEATDLALRGTFNNRPEGIFGAIARGINGVTRDVPVLKFVVPFTNVVANVFNRLIDYSPLGFARLFPWYKGGGALARTEYGGRRGSDFAAERWKQQAAQATISSMGLVALAVKAALETEEEDPKFAITGRGPGTYQRAYQLQESGWKPYSLKVGERYYSYRETPLALGLGVIGNYFDAIKYRGLSEESAAVRAEYALSRVPYQLLDQSFLTGLRDLFEGIDRDTIDPKQNTVQKVLTPVKSVVIPNLVRQIDRIFDPTVYTDDTIQEWLVRDVPVVRSQGKPMLNALGDPIRQNLTIGERTLGRFYSVEKSEDPIWNLIARTQAWIPDVRASAKLLEPDGQTRDMTPPELYAYTQRRGEWIRQIVTENMQDIEGEDPEIARKILAKIYRNAGRAAKAELQSGALKVGP